MRQISRFRRGSGCYHCRICKRLTRDVGDNGMAELCPECFEVGGLENAVSDNGPNWAHRESTLAEIARLEAVIRSKGGKL